MMNEFDTITQEEETFEFGEELSGENEMTDESEVDMAAELLSVENESELDQFLGDILSKAGQFAKQVITPNVGKHLTGMLKTVAKKAIPSVTSGIASYWGQQIGDKYKQGDLGQKIGDSAGNLVGNLANKWFGLEMEGMSGEDLELETAKRFVILAKTAARNAAKSSLSSSTPVVIAKQSLVNAARKHAPGLVTIIQGSVSGRPGGRWARKGKTIVVYGV